MPEENEQLEEQQEDKQLYYAIPIQNVQFTERELRRMGIAFMQDLSALPEAVASLGVYNVHQNDELVSHGLTLAQIGPLSHPSWVVYSIDLRFDFVSDIWNRKNFYLIYKKVDGKRKELFDKVHLREDMMEEDIQQYIDLDLQTEYREGPFNVEQSEFIH